MGLFDDVKCNMKLPGDIPTEIRRFQTKDFPCPYMDKYEITADGRLLKVRDHFRPAEEGQVDYNGILNFYTMDGDDNWWEFDANFTDGLCVGITEREPDGHRHTDMKGA